LGELPPNSYLHSNRIRFAGMEAQLASASLAHRIKEQMPTASTLYYRLVLLVGEPRSGKTAALRQFAADQTCPLVNLNLALSERLLELTTKQRAIRVSRLLDTVAKEHSADVLILDNIEILFSTELQQDPLRLLQGIARNRTVVASWAGDYQGDRLTYAEPSHPEFKQYDQPDAIIVPVEASSTPAPKAETEGQS
jgi:hypothetical protein